MPATGRGCGRAVWLLTLRPGRKAEAHLQHDGHVRVPAAGEENRLRMHVDNLLDPVAPNAVRPARGWSLEPLTDVAERSSREARAPPGGSPGRERWCSGCSGTGSSSRWPPPNRSLTRSPARWSPPRGRPGSLGVAAVGLVTGAWSAVFLAHRPGPLPSGDRDALETDAPLRRLGGTPGELPEAFGSATPHAPCP